jgi:hypothetical protein
MEENIITTEQVVETAEDVIAAADSNVLDKVVKFGFGAAIVTAVGFGIYKIYTKVKNKKKQEEEVPADDQVDFESIESAE